MMDPQQSQKALRKDRVLVLFDIADTLVNPQTHELVPGARELVERMHRADMKMGVISDCDSLTIKSMLTINGLAPFFPFVVGLDTSSLQAERIKAALEYFTRTQYTYIRRTFDEVVVIASKANGLPISDPIKIKFIAITNGHPQIHNLIRGIPHPYRTFHDLTNSTAILHAVVGKDRVKSKTQLKY